MEFLVLSFNTKQDLVASRYENLDELTDYMNFLKARGIKPLPCASSNFMETAREDGYYPLLIVKNIGVILKEVQVVTKYEVVE